MSTHLCLTKRRIITTYISKEVSLTATTVALVSLFNRPLWIMGPFKCLSNIMSSQCIPGKSIEKHSSQSWYGGQMAHEIEGT